MKHSNQDNGRVEEMSVNTASNLFHASAVILLLIALILCAAHEDEIDSFFGYDAQENTAVYEEASFRQKPSPTFAVSGHSGSPDGKGSAGPTPSPTPDPEPNSESTIEPSPEPPSTPTPDSAAEPTTEPTPVVVSTQTPDSTPEPMPSLDLFSCLGIYDDGNGNSIELRLSTEFHTISYTMQLYYNRGTSGLLGRDGQRTISDNSYVLFTVDYDGEKYPFTVQLGDGYIFVDDSNCFGPFDGHEFAGTYFMTRQF